MTIPALRNMPAQKPTVLVIDDEAGPRDALKVILRPFFNIQSAESAQAAINVLNHQQIDLITLDQKLPGSARHGPLTRDQTGSRQY